jgi:hypothetical protein
MADDKHNCAGDIQKLLEYRQQARREALEEVVTLHQEWMAGKHSGTFSDAIDRLREER